MFRLGTCSLYWCGRETANKVGWVFLLRTFNGLFTSFLRESSVFAILLAFSCIHLTSKHLSLQELGGESESGGNSLHML